MRQTVGNIIQVENPKGPTTRHGQTQYDHEDLLSFVREAQEVHGLWRPEAWYSEEMVDGSQWSEKQYQQAVDAGIFDPGEDPLVINRTFPTVQMLLGMQIVNKFMISVKGRTPKDREMGEVMSEGIQYIGDQSGLQYLITRAYKDQIVPGVGYLKVTHMSDPRKEKIGIRYRDWKEMWWDPMSDPWLDDAKCRYAFHMPYVDLPDLIAAFPQYSEALVDYANQRKSPYMDNFVNMWYDEAQRVEDFKTMWGRGQRTRQRVRPIEMWYPVWMNCLWAVFPNGDAKELTEGTDPRELNQMVMASQEIIKAQVRRMWVTVFLDNLILKDGPSPFNHDNYPFVPFIGYVDRFGFPYGVPHQMKGQQVETNKRRAMILALLRKKQVIMEMGAATGKNAMESVDNLAMQANRLDGVMVIADGGKRFEIIDGTDKNKLQAQLLMLHESERELQEISGANAEELGYKGQTVSGVAEQKRMEQSATILAPLLENLRRSRGTLGDLLVSEIQGEWKSPKVLRITDRLTGAEKFQTLNERIWNWKTGQYEIKNNVTQGKFDTVVTEVPATDTVREQNLQMLIEAVKKSPPEIIPQLITMAFDMSNLPNKDMLVAKLREIYTLDPGQEDMSAEELKARAVKALEAHQKAQEAESQFQDKMRQLTQENGELENQLLAAQVKKITDGHDEKMGDLGIKAGTLAIKRRELELKGFETGAKVGNEIASRKQDMAKFLKGQNQPERKGVTA